MSEILLLIFYNSDMLISKYGDEIWLSRQDFAQIKL